MATKYKMTVNNYSKNYGNICVFQTLPDQPDNMMSLAWFSKPAHPGTIVEFDWSMNYNFIWSDQGDLRIGMSGNGTFAVTATPNYNFTFPPHPRYWVAFGTYQVGVNK